MPERRNAEAPTRRCADTPDGEWPAADAPRTPLGRGTTPARIVAVGVSSFRRLGVSRRRRGAASVALVVLLVLLSLVVVGFVLSGARQQDGTSRMLEGLRSFYAAEAGVNMAMRELYENTDEDGDGTVGTISDDGNAANDPEIGDTAFSVSDTVNGTETTYTCTARNGEARRVAAATVEDGGGGGTPTTAMLAYALSSSNQPKYRIWNGTAWGSEASATNVGTTIYWLVLRGSPVAEYFAIATLDNDVDIEVQTWNGTSWSALTQATGDCGDKTTRLFDMAYEQTSGDILLVYRENGTSQTRYRTYNGTSWSGESSYSMVSGTIKWLRLVPKPGSDEIMVIAESDDGSSYTKAAIWNGSSFGTLSSNSGASGLSTYQHIDGAYEQSSGSGLFVFSQNSNNPGYRTYGGSWSGTSSATSVGGVPYWCRLASESGSDAIFLATLDAGNDINLVRWSGSAWGATSEIETSATDINRRVMDLAYEQAGTEAVIAYADGSSTVKYRTWNGSTWSGESSGPSGGTAPIWNLQAVTGLTAGQVFVTWCMDSPETRTAIWSGSSFGSATVLGTPVGKEYESFMAATAGAASGSSIVVGWAETAP